MPGDNIGIKQPPATSSSPVGTGGVSPTGGGVTPASPPPVDASLGGTATAPAPGGTGGPALAPPVHISPAALLTLLYALQKKSKEANIQNAELNINLRADDKRQKNDDLISKLKKVAHNKPDKAGGICAKVFAWVGVALAFVVAGVVAVVSGGMAAAPLFALALVSMGVLIAQETGGMDKMMDAMGMDDKQKMIFSISLTVALLVLNVGATVATGGVSAVTSVVSSVTRLLADTGAAAAEGAAVGAEGAATAAEGAAAASEAAATASEGAAAAAEGAAESAEASSAVAEGAGEGATAATEGTTSATEEGTGTAASAAKSAKVMKAANKLRASAQVVSGGSMVAGGGIGVDTSVKEYNATMARADVMQDKAILQKLLAMDEDDMQRIRHLIEQLQNATSMVMDTMSSADETATKIRTSV